MTPYLCEEVLGSSVFCGSNFYHGRNCTIDAECKMDNLYCKSSDGGMGTCVFCRLWEDGCIKHEDYYGCTPDDGKCCLGLDGIEYYEGENCNPDEEIPQSYYSYIAQITTDPAWTDGGSIEVDSDLEEYFNGDDCFDMNVFYSLIEPYWYQSTRYQLYYGEEFDIYDYSPLGLYMKLNVTCSTGGCTDPKATNYNNLRSTPDGSCIYNSAKPDSNPITKPSAKPSEYPELLPSKV
jgi:hypothetical protein